MVNCYVLHKCGRSVMGAEPADTRNIIPEAVKMFLDKRQTGLCGVPQYNFDICHDQLRGVNIDTSIPSPGTAQFDNVPPACMNLATVLGGGCGVGPPYPIPCGSACLSYSGISDYQMGQLSQALAPYGH